MGLRKSYGVSRYASGEGDLFVGTSAHWALGGVRGVLFLHGASGNAASLLDYSVPGTRKLVETLATVYPVLAIDAGGAQAWGNSTSTSRCGDGRTRLQGTLNSNGGPWGAKSGTIIVVGESMGALAALNYAKANPTHVAAVVGILPVCDLNDMVTNNRGGSASAINAAYGGTYSEATHGPTSNPTNYKASYSTPTQLYYATDDTTVIASTVTGFASGATNVTATSLGTGGHSETAIEAAPRADIMSWLAQFA